LKAIGLKGEPDTQSCHALRLPSLALFRIGYRSTGFPSGSFCNSLKNLKQLRYLDISMVNPATHRPCAGPELTPISCQNQIVGTLPEAIGPKVKGKGLHHLSYISLGGKTGSLSV
jgi:hypothetical protein